jgi:SAM-dependent methyltransferase
VQWVTTRLLTDLWAKVFTADATSSFAGLKRFGLWQSPTGLYFFDPPCEGDHTFYAGLHRALRRRRLYRADAVREEFLLAAKRIPEGARVLDVGCGNGRFRRCVADTDYTGLDPYFEAEAAHASVRNESLEQHLVESAGSYDAVCAFQVIEHLRDPKAFFASMVEAAKPGGLIFIGAPHVPSAFTRIPNYVVNAPPHHLTWWTREAMGELAAGAGAMVESVENVPWGPADAAIYWMERFSPIKCSDAFYRGSARWHAAAVTGLVAGILVGRVIGPPKRTTDEGAGLLMTARRPGSPWRSALRTRTVSSGSSGPR